MGFMSFLFGGPKVFDTTTPEIRSLADRLGSFDPGISMGLGKAGKVAKGYLGDIQAGRLDKLPSVMLAQAQGARDWSELQRNLQMRTAMMPGQQTALTAGLLSKGYLANQNNAGLRALQGAASDISNFSNIFQGALQGRRSAQEASASLRERGLEGAAGILQRGRQVYQDQGLFGKLGQIGGAIAPFIPGGQVFGGLSRMFGGGGGGMGGLGMGDIGFCWIARELYGEADPRVDIVRNWLLKWASESTLGTIAVKLYRKFGERVADLIREHSWLRSPFQRVFDKIVEKAEWQTN